MIFDQPGLGSVKELQARVQMPMTQSYIGSAHGLGSEFEAICLICSEFLSVSCLLARKDMSKVETSKFCTVCPFSSFGAYNRASAAQEIAVQVLQVCSAN